MAEPVRVAVVGSGYFGRFHANHYARNPRAKLVAVVDTDAGRAEAVAGEFGGAPAADYRDILGKVDAASVAVPTSITAAVRMPAMIAGAASGRRTWRRTWPGLIPSARAASTAFGSASRTPL